MFFSGVLVLTFLTVVELLHVRTCLKDQTGVNMQKEICRKQEIFT